MPKKILFVLTVVFVLTLTGVQPVVAERWQDWGVGRLLPRFNHPPLTCPRVFRKSIGPLCRT